MARVTHLGFEVKVDVDLADDERAGSNSAAAARPSFGLQAGQRVWVARADAEERPDRLPSLSA